jgi:flagellar biosynthesis/type III secretory pathway protein FliH
MEITVMKTAVDWLVEQLTPSIALQQKYIDEVKEQAKQMEKEQLEEARLKGYGEGYHEGLYDAENK